MDVVIASLNKTKINAVKTIFQGYTIIPKSLSSDVSEQPVGDEETRRGALNRARHASNLIKNGIGIGLEGGVMFIGDEFYLCNWGALIDPYENEFTASGARIKLPEQFGSDLLQGIELSTLMDAYTKKKDIRNHEGAIGVFTNQIIDRAAMFSHVVQLLKGQMEYSQKNIKGS